MFKNSLKQYIALLISGIFIVSGFANVYAIQDTSLSEDFIIEGVRSETDKDKNALEESINSDGNNGITINGVTLHDPYRDSEKTVTYKIIKEYEEKPVVIWDCVWFGNYWQSSSDTNGEKEPIKWRILSIEDNKALLLSEKILDWGVYHNVYEDITWERCTLRSWLKDDFYNNAFNDAEKSSIKSTELTTLNGPFATESTTTTDTVFLPTIEDCSNPDYGFDETYIISSNLPFYCAQDPGRCTKPTLFAINQGVKGHDPLEDSGSVSYAGNADWWLRAPNSMTWPSGVMHLNTTRVNDTDGIGIRPALYLDLSDTSVWDYAGKVLSNGEIDEKLPVTGVSIPSEITLKTGKSTKIVPEITPENASSKAVKYTLSKEGIISIDKDGTITGIKEGEVIVTVETLNRNLKDTCKVIVKQSVTGINMSLPKDEITPDENIKIEYEVLPSNAADKTVSFSSSDTNIASVDETGIVTGHNEGITILLVKTNDGGYTASCNLIVKKQKDQDTDHNNEDNEDPGSKTINMKQIIFKTKDENNKTISMNIIYTNAVTYNTKSHVSKEYDKPKKNNTQDVSVQIDSPILKYADVSGLKFKNNKKITNGKTPYFVIKIKPKKGISPEQKAIVKAVSKELKNEMIKFELKPYDLSKAKVTVELNKNKDTMKITKKIFVTMDNKMVKLSKKDCDIEIKNDSVIITGKGNFTGKIIK